MTATVRFIAPNGKTITVDPAHYDKLVAAGALPLDHHPDATAEERDASPEFIRVGPDTAGLAAGHTRERCTLHPYSWHYPDAISCHQFNLDLVGGAGFSELTEHPNALVKHAGATYRQALATVRDEFDNLNTAYTRNLDSYQGMITSNRRWILFFAAALGISSALHLARSVWGF